MNTYYEKNQNKSTLLQEGFSLIEILVALAIVLLVGGIGLNWAMNQYKKSQINATKQTLKTVVGAIDSFHMDTQQYPDSLEDLIQRPENEELAKNWSVQYLGKKPGDKKSLNDSWGNQLQYSKTSEGENPYELYSYGPNGKRAPEGEWIQYWKLN